jgi:hypothetical protein
MKIVRRAFTVVAAGVLVLAGAAGCAAERTESNEIKLVYKSGMGDDRVFDRCIAPTTAGDPIYDNDVFTLPTDKRTWNIAPDPDPKHPDPGIDQRTPIVSGTVPTTDPETKERRPGPAVDVWLTTDFYLNWDCGWDYGKDGAKSLNKQKGSATSPIVTFFNRTGRTAQISSDSGKFDIDNWRSMLRTTLAKVEQDVIQSETRKYDADDLDANIGDVYARMEATMGPEFQKALNEKMGGDYFCGVEFDGGKIVHWTEKSYDPVTGQIVETAKTGKCPPVRIDITNIDLHDKAIQDARTQTYVAEQTAKAALVKAESDKTVADLAKDPNVMRLKEMENERAIAEACAKGGNCTLIQGLNPGAVNVPAK